MLKPVEASKKQALIKLDGIQSQCKLEDSSSRQKDKKKKDLSC